MCTSFGQDNPRKVPSYLLTGSKHLAYEKAKRADTTQQNFSVCPRHWYIDATIACTRCRKDFVFSTDEQRYWYEQLKFYVDSWPTTCPDCRGELRKLKTLRQTYDQHIHEALTTKDRDLQLRIASVIDSLSDAGLSLPDQVLSNHKLLLKQIEKMKTGDDTMPG